VLLAITSLHQSHQLSILKTWTALEAHRLNKHSLQCPVFPISA